MATAAADITNIAPAENAAEAYLNTVMERQREAIARDGMPSYEQRIKALKKLEKFLIEQQDEIVATINADFGRRAAMETIQAEIFTVVEESRHARKKLKKWMRPKRVSVGLNWAPASAKLHTKPLGIVGIIGAWNYPLQLTLSPMVGAIAAGNRIMLKPSDTTSGIADYMKAEFARIYAEDYVAVCAGGMDMAVAFSSMPFDHLCFTGSTRVGKLVMQAAAKNLVPVTLELGGKSPAVFGTDFNVDKHAKRLMRGKLYNAGQTCIAPDYVMVPKDKRDDLVAMIQQQSSELYPEFVHNDEYTAIQSQGHYDRLKSLLEDAEAKGARVIPASESGDQPDDDARILPPMLVIDPTEDMLVMQDEIFGPILPVITYQNVNEAIGYINGRDHPLALYFFGSNKTERDLVIESTTFGGGCVNETLYHQPQLELPFGGVGSSGIGAYHGKFGYDRFSKASGVFYQARWTPLDFLTAPYNKWVKKLVSFLIGKAPKVD